MNKTPEQISLDLEVITSFEFVCEHRKIYKDLCDKLLQINDTVVIPELTQIFKEWQELELNSIFPTLEELRAILSNMPDVLLQLSSINKIYYNFINEVILIKINNDWEIYREKIDKSEYDYSKHSTMFYTWMTANNDMWIYFFHNPITKDILSWNYDLNNEDLIEIKKQFNIINVFLHEFMHTVINRINEIWETALIYKSEEFTLQSIFDDFKKIIFSEKEPESISPYAEYSRYDFETNNTSNNPIEEAICETFVSYQLGILLSKELIEKNWWNPSFKEYSFWNIKQKNKFDNKESESANKKWLLMNKLMNSKIVETSNV